MTQLNRWIFSFSFTVSLFLFLFFYSYQSPYLKSAIAEQAAHYSEISLVSIPQKKLQNQTATQPLTQEGNFPTQHSIQEQTPSQESAAVDAAKNFAKESQFSSESEESKKIIADYKQYALSRIASRKSYPLTARAQSQEGRVRLRVEIGEGGRLIAYQVVESSSFALLDEAALKAVEKSAPFKPLTDDVKAKQVVLNFYMDFTLDSNS